MAVSAHNALLNKFFTKNIDKRTLQSFVTPNRKLTNDIILNGKKSIYK